MQDELPLTVKRGRKGRHETAADRTVAAARADDTLTGVDAVLATAVRALGRQLDVAERKSEPYASAAVVRELLAVLRSARLTPEQRPGAVADPFAELVAALAE